MLALLPGCLTAPPDAIGGDGGLSDGGKLSDGATGCTKIVEDDFGNDGIWFSSTTGSGELGRFDDRVEISIVPVTEPGYVELTSLEQRPIEGTRVEATLVVDRSDAGNVSIAFDGTSSGAGYYEIAISNGVVEAVRDDGSRRLLCAGQCPAYARDLHQRFRLRARQDRVHYESWDGELWTELVPSQAGSPADFTVSMKAIGEEGEGVIDALLSELTWQECAE